ncbi:MAG: ABC transporter permease [Acidobacteriota bacterium]|nr:ABC transporter permease [Acidobacteriota bacterium]
MRKFWAVVKREYLKLVWAKTFIIGTLLAPLMSIGFMVVPALIFSIEGDAVRVGIVDQSGKLFTPVSASLLTSGKREKQDSRDAIANSVNQSQQERARQAAEQLGGRFLVEEVRIGDKSLEQIRRELDARLIDQSLDVYVVIPPNFEQADFELYARNTSDFIAQERIQDALNNAVREVRLSDANLSREKLEDINREVNLTTKRVTETGVSDDSGESFLLLFVVALLIYLVLAIYGQTILGAVVEEKETRIAEILFSSARPFTLMMGKLVGVGLVALTQLGIWVVSAAILGIYGISQFQRGGLDISFPHLSPFFVVGLFIFFLLGFFTYATIYALIGSMVTTVQEGGQLAFPPILLLLMALYSAFPVIRSPNSDFAFWLSIAPFVSPIVMPVRMAIQTPQLWQVLLSILINLATIFGLIWIAARAYRIGMLMYGKKATIPEVLKWIRQA